MKRLKHCKSKTLEVHGSLALALLRDKGSEGGYPETPAISDDPEP